MQDGSPRVTVSVRVRPKLDHAVSDGHRAERYEKMACAAVSDTNLRLWDGKLTKDSRSTTFSFDHILDVDTTQTDVYETTAVDAVDAVLRGTNASILTYGQTGSGKTYTVLGGIRNNPLADDVVTEHTGVLMRAIEEVLSFAARMRAQRKRDIRIGISVVEIYLEEVRDLLNPRSTQGTIVSAALVRNIVRLDGLTCAPLDTLADAIEAYKRSSARRVQRSTCANDTSSRSHAVFSIEVFQAPYGATSPDRPGATALSLDDCLRARDAYVAASLDPQQRGVRPAHCAMFDGAANPLLGTSECPIMYSKLTVADLAGSEKARHSDVRGEGFEELRKINGSLTALGNVVHSLFEGAKHIPYRDCKLTLVLRDTFAAPCARISLVVNVSPTVLSFDETLSSLYFADKVKAMRVRSTAKSHDATLEEAYLRSLQAHDALLADVRIFACERELTGTAVLSLPRAEAWLPQGSRLFEPAVHTVGSDGAVRAANLRALCIQLRAKVAKHDETARTQVALKEHHRAVRDEVLADYVQARAAVRKELREEAAAVERVRAEEQAREAKMLAVLESDHQAYTAVHKERQMLVQSKRDAVVRADAVAQLELQTAMQMRVLELEHAKDPALHDSVAPTEGEDGAMVAQDVTWESMSRSYLRSLELAQLRYQWTGLYAYNARPGRAGSRAASLGTTATSASAESEPAVWLRRAVLAMTGNAVVISARRHRAQRSPGILCSVDSNRLPKYWTQKRIVEEERRRRPLRHSVYDDPSLSDTIAAFMEMGGCMQRLSKDGTLHRRLFYVVERRGLKRLCWDAAEHKDQRMSELSCLGHVELHTVTGMFLGQDTPTFTRCKTQADYYTSFSLEYRSSASSSSRKYLDLVCESVREMETWVMGLSQATGQFPRYLSTSQPHEGEAGVEGGVAPAAVDLTAAERGLVRDWRLPVRTLIEARTEVSARRVRWANQVMAITPGELAEVTKLDIFRACALWLHLRAEGLVDNPGARLFCYIEAKEGRSSAGTEATTTTLGATDSPHDTAEPSPDPLLHTLISA